MLKFSLKLQFLNAVFQNIYYGNYVLVVELHSLYENHLEDLGNNKSVKNTRLKNQLLEHFEEAQEQSDGKKTLFWFSKKGMRNMLKEALKKRDFTENAQILTKAASIIRKDIFNHDAFKFEGSFPENCEETSLPSSLKTLISLIFNGVCLKKQDTHESFARCAQNPNIADVIFQVEPEIKMFWFPISLLFSSKIILKQLFASGSVNIGEYLPSRRLSKYSPIFISPSANNC